MRQPTLRARGSTPLAPPGIVLPARLEGAEGVDPAGPEPTVDLRALLGQEAALAGVLRRAGQVDFPVGGVEIAHHQDAVAPAAQPGQAFEEGAVEVELEGNSAVVAQLAAALGKVDVGQDEAPEAGQLQAPLAVETRLAERDVDPIRGDAAQQGDAAVAAALRGAEVRGPARRERQLRIQLLGEGPHLLQPRDVGPAVLQPRQEGAFAEARA